VRERGNVVRSADLTAAASVLAAAATMNFLGEDLVGSLAQMLRDCLSVPAWTDVELSPLFLHLWKLAQTIGKTLLPVLAMLVLAAVGINVAQVGFLLSTESLGPNFGKLNPIAGFQRIASLQGTVRLVSSLLKLAVLVAIVIGFVMGQLPRFIGASDLNTSTLFRQIGVWLISLGFQLSIGLIVLAILDYGFQFWKFEQDIKMTKQEIRDEMRHMEGDPHIRARRREAHRKLSNARQVHKAKDADVVVTNPTEIAVAIKYDPQKMEAPVVLAKGKGLLAQRIREVAAENGIPIIEKKPLARALFASVKIGHPIPVEMYEAVAEILAYVYRLSKGKRKRA
jgi:flagellar biosynthetic protein FlhB